MTKCGFCGAPYLDSGIMPGVCDSCVRVIERDDSAGDIIRFAFGGTSMVRLTVRRDRTSTTAGVLFVFTGSPTGEHQVWEPRFDARALDRAYAHWDGYKSAALVALTGKHSPFAK